MSVPTWHNLPLIHNNTCSMYHWPPYIILDTFPTSSTATFQTPNWKHPSNKSNSTSIMEERYRDNYPLENVEK
ncbi:hypothetical protein MTR_4g083550 [Medicago truncatula]|uniref:Uncharacterized protein n=1 Tax=Medicago truncatula TaxID=3880 RepID=G7JIQ7_MEDTR|nr:hypothetical protein MTR_4g083550 [Medicago truncatula]